MKQITLRHKGKPGPAVEGLTLSAVQAGEKPQPGQAVTLWITITNNNTHDIHLYQHFWRYHPFCQHYEDFRNDPVLFRCKPFQSLPMNLLVINLIISVRGPFNLFQIDTVLKHIPKRRQFP